jgi:hypothetical protein
MDEMVRLNFGPKVVEVHRILSIPDEGALVIQLRSKLAEYRRRLAEPDLDAHRETSTNFKIWVLQQLLDKQNLDFLQVKSSVAGDIENYSLSMAYLAYAWKVIENYCYYHGDFNHGGTGLPPLPWTVASTSPFAIA